VKLINDHPSFETVSLSEQEAGVLEDAIADFVPQLETIEESSVLDQLEIRAGEIAPDIPQLHEYLTDFGNHKGAKAVLVDLSSQTHPVPPTPTAYPESTERDLHKPDLYRGILLGLVGLYGYGFETMQSGRIHNNIIPIKQHADTVGHNASSNYYLGLHNEVASFNLAEGYDVSPDFLTLHFFRNNKLVPTVISTYEVDELDRSVRELLCKEWFVNQTSPAQGGKNNAVNSVVSVLYGPEKDPWSRISTACMHHEDYTEDQVNAINAFVEHLEERAVNLPLRAGFLALIDNRRALHGRPQYRSDQKPQYDGTDRWQRRITASSSKQRIQAYESRSRVVDMERFRKAAAIALGKKDAQL